MGPVTAQLLDELGYDPDDGVPQLAEVTGAGVPGPAFHVPAGAIIRARDGARPVAVARLDSGRVVVVDDVCPHDGGRISDGFVDGERLVCARHGWELEVVGGRCARRDARRGDFPGSAGDEGTGRCPVDQPARAESASCGNSSNC